MDQLRVDALQHFNERSHFTNIARDCYVLVQNEQAFWAPCPESQLLEQAKSRMEAAESVLITVPFVSADMHFDFERENLIALIDAMGIDHAVFRPLSSIESTFCWFPSDRNDTFYARVSMMIFVWTFDRSSRTTRGLLIPCGYSKYSQNVQGTLDSSRQAIACDVELLNKPVGLLWHCFMYGATWAKMQNDVCWTELHTVERRTGYGASTKVADEEDPDLYTGCLRSISRTSSVLATCRKQCGNLTRAYQCLALKDGSGQPQFEDQGALSVAKGYLDSEVAKIEELSERTRNQAAVLFSLIARVDTQASIRLAGASTKLAEANFKVAKAAKEDSGAMKTISIMTMLFLPATYFAALFSMPTLQWGQTTVINDRFWVYWIFTIPTTCAVFLVWAVKNRRTLMRLRKQPIQGREEEDVVQV